MERGTIEYRLKDLEKNRDKYYHTYQQDGSPSAMRTFEKYDDLCEICYKALETFESGDEERMRRMRNFRAFVQGYKDIAHFSPGKIFTVQEVVEILERAKGLV